MSGIVLSASVRQNLLSLQSTASLLATTQNDLATGNAVNSALDNPTNFFTAQSLNSRAGDIGNLLDSIGNGVQVLQAANTGITSLQSLISSAQSIANQVLQAPTGFSTKSSVSATITGANANNLLGTTTFSSATATSNVIADGAAGGTAAITATTSLGGIAGTDTGTAVTGLTAAKTLNTGGTGAALGVVAGDVLNVNGHTVTFESGAAPTTAPSGFTEVTASSGALFTDANGNSEIFLGAAPASTTATVGDVLTSIDLASGVQSLSSTGALTPNGTASSVSAGNQVVLNSSTGADLTISGRADLLSGLGLTTATGSGTAVVNVDRTTSSTTFGSLIQAGSTLNVDGKTITFENAAAPTAANVPAGSGVSGGIVTDGNGNSTVFLQSAKASDVLNAIDLATGVQTATNSSGAAALKTTAGQTDSSVSASGTLNISTGVNADLNITGTGNALAVLGLTGATGNATSFTASRNAAAGSLAGETLTIGATGGGTATDITFGSGAGQVSTLNELNAALTANNLQATVNTTGALTISTTDNAASATIGAIAGTATASGSAFFGLVAAAPVLDPNSQATRANLVSQYNNVLQQINTTSQDSSFNGVNLLNGDTLNLTFDETGASKLAITGVIFNDAGLGLSTLTAGTDFLDNNSANAVLTNLQNASNTLSTEASALGSNLSIVQIRQDFNKNLINVLQTGASSLTLADPNQEAANSQALSTRQSIAVSALALANQSQQSVLQLLR
jgi:flagellin